MIVVLDEDASTADLERGEISCGCGGRLAPWGHSAPRTIRHRGGSESRRRWRRGRCRDCGVTHVLIAGVLPRRRDALPTVISALLWAADGAGHRPIAATLTLPPATVRNWLRRARSQAAWLERVATVWAHTLDPVLGRPPRPTGDPLTDALGAIGIAAAAYVRRFGPHRNPAQLIAALTGGQLLAAPSG